MIGWPSREWGEIGLDISVPRAGMAIDDAEPDIVAARPDRRQQGPKARVRVERAAEVGYGTITKKLVRDAIEARGGVVNKSQGVVA